jgi:hypothetical protein
VVLFGADALDICAVLNRIAVLLYMECIVLVIHLIPVEEGVESPVLMQLDHVFISDACDNKSLHYCL